MASATRSALAAMVRLGLTPIEVDMKDRGPQWGLVSAMQEATGVLFRQTGADYDFDFHTAPRRQ